MNKLKARIDAFNRFVVDAKAANVWDSIEAACIMAGWSNVAGALTPLKGAAPTNNGFLAADFDRGIGITGDKSSYLDSGRESDDDPQNDAHFSVFPASLGTGNANLIGTDFTVVAADLSGFFFQQSPLSSAIRSRSASAPLLNVTYQSGNLIGASRNSGSVFTRRYNSSSDTVSAASYAPSSARYFIFARNNAGSAELQSDATLAWYSIGSSVDLAALDTVVSQLAADLRAIDEDGFDPLATDYIRRVEAADGAYLETGVKQAINAFVVGCRKDGLLDAIKASCIMAGARTIEGALVPLKGTAPTPYNLTNFDYARTTGIKGDGSTTYIDSNRANDADGRNDKHLAVYVQSPTTADGNFHWYIADGGSSVVGVLNIDKHYSRVNDDGADAPGGSVLESGVIAASRATSGEISMRLGGTTYPLTVPSATPSTLNHLLFRRNSPIIPGYSDARLAFYGIGSAISDLSLLDNRVSTLISSISTALS